MGFQQSVAVYIDNILALAVIQRQIQRPGLALRGVQPLHAQFRKLLLALGVHLKAAVLPLVIHQEHPDALPGIGAVVNGFQTAVQRVRRVVHGDDNGDIWIYIRSFIAAKMPKTAPDQQKKAA